MSTRRLRIQIPLGLAIIFWSIVYPYALDTALAEPEELHLRVCFLSTTEEPSCATIAESYSPPPSPPSPPSP